MAAGGVATSIPIVIHLLNKRKFRIIVWAAMDFLLAAQRRNARKLKFRRWLLLAVRSSDTVARLSGDEFTVILHDIEGRDEVGVVASKMVTRLAEGFDLDGHQANVKASIGIAVFPDDADDAAELVRLADRAMYGVKGAGKNNFGFHQPPERLVYPLDA